MTRRTYFDKRRIGWKMDMDYWEKLSAEEKAWYMKFGDEYYLAYYRDKPLHTDPKHIKDNKDRDNAQARDLLNVSENFTRLDDPVSVPESGVIQSQYDVIDSESARMDKLWVREPHEPGKK